MPEIPNNDFYCSFQPLDIVRGAYRIPLNKPLFEGVAYWKEKFIWTLDTTKSYFNYSIIIHCIKLRKITSLDFDYKPRPLFE